MKFPTVAVLLLHTFVATANLLPRQASCPEDNCFRAVWGTFLGQDHPLTALRDCLNHLTTTVAFFPIATITVVNYETSTTVVGCLATPSSSALSSLSSTSSSSPSLPDFAFPTATPIPRDVAAGRVRARQNQALSSSSTTIIGPIPTYVGGSCGNQDSVYASACSCKDVTSSILSKISTTSTRFATLTIVSTVTSSGSCSSSSTTVTVSTLSSTSGTGTTVSSTSSTQTTGTSTLSSMSSSLSSTSSSSSGTYSTLSTNSTFSGTTETSSTLSTSSTGISSTLSTSTTGTSSTLNTSYTSVDTTTTSSTLSTSSASSSSTGTSSTLSTSSSSLDTTATSSTLSTTTTGTSSTLSTSSSSLDTTATSSTLSTSSSSLSTGSTTTTTSTSPTPSCPVLGTIRCNDTCITATNDRLNCGRCGNRCADGFSCVNGVCGRDPCDSDCEVKRPCNSGSKRNCICATDASDHGICFDADRYECGNSTLTRCLQTELSSDPTKLGCPLGHVCIKSICAGNCNNTGVAEPAQLGICVSTDGCGDAGPVQLGSLIKISEEEKRRRFVEDFNW